MDTTLFDTLTRSVSASTTRRSALRGLVAGAATLVAGGVLLNAEDTAAGRRKRRKGKGKGRNTLRPGDRCTSNKQCPSSYICDVAVNASNSDETCCGAEGAGCGAKNEDGDDTAPFCCVGYQCVFTNSNGSSTWTCQAVPDEF